MDGKTMILLRLHVARDVLRLYEGCGDAVQVASMRRRIDELLDELLDARPAGRHVRIGGRR